MRIHRGVTVYAMREDDMYYLLACSSARDDDDPPGEYWRLIPIFVEAQGSTLERFRDLIASAVELPGYVHERLLKSCDFGLEASNGLRSIIDVEWSWEVRR